jgi:hypothetical protein
MHPIKNRGYSGRVNNSCSTYGNRCVSITSFLILFGFPISWIYVILGLVSSTISSYHHYSSNPAHGDMFSIQDYVIKLVSDLRWFSPGTSVSSTYKTDRHDIAFLVWCTQIVLCSVQSPPKIKMMSYTDPTKITGDETSGRLFLLVFTYMFLWLT